MVGDWVVIDQIDVTHPHDWSLHDDRLVRDGRTPWAREMAATNGCFHREGLHVHERLTAYNVSGQRMYILDHCLDADSAVLFIYALVTED